MINFILILIIGLSLCLFIKGLQLRSIVLGLLVLLTTLLSVLIAGGDYVLTMSIVLYLAFALPVFHIVTKGIFEDTFRKYSKMIMGIAGVVVVLSAGLLFSYLRESWLLAKTLSEASMLYRTPLFVYINQNMGISLFFLFGFIGTTCLLRETIKRKRERNA